MRVWVDLTNSPHVLVMRPLIEHMRADGHEVRVTARDFAQTIALCERFGIEHEAVGRHRGERLAAKARGLASRSAAVFVSRMLPIIRTFISLPAGVAKMPFVRFTLLTLIGCAPWVLGLGLAGEAVGSEWKSVRKGFDYVDYAVLALVVASLAYLLLRRRRGGGPAPEVPAAEESAGAS